MIVCNEFTFETWVSLVHITSAHRRFIGGIPPKWSNSSINSGGRRRGPQIWRVSSTAHLGLHKIWEDDADFVCFAKGLWVDTNSEDLSRICKMQPGAGSLFQGFAALFQSTSWTNRALLDCTQFDCHCEGECIWIGCIYTSTVQCTRRSGKLTWFIKQTKNPANKQTIKQTNKQDTYWWRTNKYIWYVISRHISDCW